MKTSSKILIGLLSTIFLVMSAMFIDVRVFGVHRSEHNPITKTQNFQLDDYKYLVVENLKSFAIKPSGTNHINFIAYNDTINSNIKYTINNDTLKIIGSSSPSYMSSYTLYTKSVITSISTKKSNIRISGLNQENIHLKVSDGELNSYGKSTNEFSHFKNVRITQLNSRIHFDNIKVDTLNLLMEKSNARFGREIHQVNASIESGSELNLKNVEKLELVKDKSSRIHIR